MRLEYKNDTFLVYPEDDGDGHSRCNSAGLDFSRPGQVFFTKEPYAALEFYSHGNSETRQVLASYHKEYRASYAQGEMQGVLREPPGLALMPFQRAGVAYALQRDHALIGDQPGLGKTAQAIVLGNELGAKRTLVICPAAVRRHWRAEAIRWSTLPKVYPYPIERASDGVSPSSEYVIASYNLVGSQGPVFDALMQYDWDHIIIDEAHYLKTPDTNRTRALFGRLDENVAHLAQKARRITGLTGTPLPNRPRECYTITRSLCWEAFDWMSYDKFRHRFNPSYFGREETGRLGELRARLRCNFMVRRQKRAVLPQMPEKTYELAYVEPNGAISKVLKAERELVGNVADVEAFLDNLNPNMDLFGQISTLRMQMGVAKVPRIVEHVAMTLDGGVEKVVVYAWHRDVMAMLEEKLGRFGVVVYKGGMSDNQKDERKAEFIRNPEKQIMLAQLMAMGTGVDGLQAVCSHAIFAEADWAPGNNEQALDRLDRMGQEGKVLGQFLVAPGSMDEKILGRAIEKARDTKEALDG